MVQPRRPTDARDPRDVRVLLKRVPIIPHHVRARAFIYVHHRARVNDPDEHEYAQHVIRQQVRLVSVIQPSQPIARQRAQQRPDHARRRPWVLKQRIVQSAKTSLET